MTLEPLVTVSWICAIWQGVSSFVLQASVFKLMSLGCSVAYLWAPAIMASQKPPVALVIRVTLMGPVAAGPVMLVGAELLPTSPAALVGATAVPLVGAAGNLHHVIHRVRDQDHGDTVVTEPSDQVQHTGRLAQPEGCRRLVEDHELGGKGDGAGNRDRLPLTTGHQRHVGVEVRQTYLQPVQEVT